MHTRTRISDAALAGAAAVLLLAAVGCSSQPSESPPRSTFAPEAEEIAEDVAASHGAEID